MSNPDNPLTNQTVNGYLKCWDPDCPKLFIEHTAREIHHTASHEGSE